MKKFLSEQLRNIGLGGHSGSGKTSLAEAMLFCMGQINRRGTIEDGNTVSDFNEDEIERQVSINTSLMHGEWKDNKINIIDTPGFSDFYGDMVSGMRAADTMMIVVSAASGVEVGTEKARQLADKYHMPRFYAINKLDRENVSFRKVYDDLRQRFGKKITIAQIPLQSGPAFSSVVDIIKQKVFKYANDGSGKVTIEDVPGDVQERLDEIRMELMESVAESDDQLLEAYFEAGELSEDQLKDGLRKAILNQLVVPVVCASATTNTGVSSLLDFIAEYIPSAAEMPPVKLVDESERPVKDSEPMTALTFKTVSEAHVGELAYIKVVSGTLKTGDDVQNSTHNKSERIGQMFCLNGKNKETVDELHAGDVAALVKLKSTHTGDTLCQKGRDDLLPPIDFPESLIEFAVEAKTKGDEDKIGTGLNSLHEEDPTFLVKFDPELKQTLIYGQGELQLRIILKRLASRFGVEVETVEPRIAYRETIRKSAEAQGKFKKQTGGRGQYGDASIRLEPMPRGEGFEFVDAIVGGAIPGKFIPAVEKGAREICEQGVISGCQVVDVKVTVYDGSYHNVDSSEMAFKVAATMGFKKAFMDASPVLLEPIYKLEVKVPEDYMGDVMGDISSRRGKIAGMDSDGRFQVVNANVPLAELYKYSTALRSMTHGQGIFHREFSHYEEVASDVAKKIMDAYQAQKDEA